MITAHLHGQLVAATRPDYAHSQTADLTRIVSEIAERLAEMEELRCGAASDFILRMAIIARVDAGSLALLIACLHGNIEAILDSYAAKGDRIGRDKQVVHYRTMREIEVIRAVFPEAGRVIDRIRESVRHHEEPESKADALRSSTPTAND